MDFVGNARSPASAGLVLCLLSGCFSGSSLNWGAIEASSVARARLGLLAQERQRRLHPPDEEKPEKETPSSGSVIVGELLAIFPGMFIHGLGHYYAGDYQTATRLRHIGEFGYMMTAVGAGTAVGGYFLDKNDQLSFAYTLYGTGGVVGTVGLAYFFTAWVYDMIDTPRAVESGGRPPPRSSLVESMDIFE